MSESDFRKYVPKMGSALHFGHTPKSFLASLPAERLERRRKKLAPLEAEAFKGVTTDGTVQPGLFQLRDEGAPTAQVLDAVTRLFAVLSPEQIAAISNPIDSKGRHRWTNGIPRYETFGLWLDELTPEAREAALAVVAASLSGAGFEAARNVMKLNGYLGELVGAPELLGEYCYQLHFFGAPLPSEPWGWQLYGHHLSLTCFVLGNQITYTPTFMGAEPRFADQGPLAEVKLFDDQERLGLDFVRGLTAGQRDRAVIHGSILASQLPAGRLQGSDGMIYGGYYRDNVVVPYEGVAGADLAPEQRRRLLDLTARYLFTLPEGPLRARMEQVQRHIDTTHFCWSGGTEEESTFYYRIQSPVVMIEFDHHKGVVLKNGEPKRFHTHTVVRTPNGNDYGMDLLRLHYETAPHHAGAAGHHHDHDHHHHHDHHQGEDGPDER